MRRALLAAGLLVFSLTCLAQTTEIERTIQKLVPYASMKAVDPTMTYSQYLAAVRTLAESQSAEYLGRLSGNRFAPDSTSNPFGSYGSPFSPTSINNKFGEYGSPFSSTGVRNRFATDTPQIYAEDGKYLGKLSTNPYDPDSVSNPFGQYGSRFSPDSINNPFGQYGSRFSPLSPNNPFTTTAPIIVAPRTMMPPVLTTPALPVLPTLPALPKLPGWPPPR
jgi:hypothetical protein